LYTIPSYYPYSWRH